MKSQLTRINADNQQRQKFERYQEGRHPRQIVQVRIINRIEMITALFDNEESIRSQQFLPFYGCLAEDQDIN